MPKRTSKKQPSDVNLLAASIVQAATEEKPTIDATLHNAAVALGRLGGLKGGKARAASLSSKRRREIARRAAAARWARKRKP
jgi:hypothetical protein